VLEKREKGGKVFSKVTLGENSVCKGVVKKIIDAVVVVAVGSSKVGKEVVRQWVRRFLVAPSNSSSWFVSEYGVLVMEARKGEMIGWRLSYNKPHPPPQPFFFSALILECSQAPQP